MRWLGCAAVVVVLLVGCGDDDPSPEEALDRAGNDLACGLLEDAPTGDAETVAAYVDVAAASASDEEFEQQIKDAAEAIRDGGDPDEELAPLLDRC